MGASQDQGSLIWSPNNGVVVMRTPTKRTPDLWKQPMHTILGSLPVVVGHAILDAVVGLTVPYMWEICKGPYHNLNHNIRAAHYGNLRTITSWECPKGGP